MKPVRRFIEQHPLVFVMTIAVVLRAIAIVFSKGFMFSDDYYETISVAYNWLRYGLLAPNGLLTWGNHTPGDITRFPLYTLFLYGIMRVYHALGVDSLATMMYGIRAVHALLSLLPVYAAYRVAAITTRSNRWALLGGLIAAAHFAMPFLAVRTLIELVGGYFWTFALYYCYRYLHDRQLERYIIGAAIMAGTAWLIRFQIVTAIVAVPFILVWEYRRWREAILFGGVFLGMVLLGGVIDLRLLGGFLASLINHVKQGLTEPPPYQTAIFIYPAVLIAFFIPPLSVVLFVLAAAKRFWTAHKLMLTSVTFVLIHSLMAARQERYMLPIVGAVMMLIVLVIWQQDHLRGLLSRFKRTFYVLATFSLVVNLILLALFTGNYAHKGVVEPLVRIERMSHHPSILFMTPERIRIFPLEYAGYAGLRRHYVTAWDQMNQFRTDPTVVESIDYYLVYPGDSHNLPRYLDSLQQITGPLDLLFHVRPSLVDRLLHAVNRKHNANDEVWVFGPAQE